MRRTFFNKILLVAFISQSLFACASNNNTHVHNYIHHEAVLYDEQNGVDEYYECSGCSSLFDKDKNVIYEIPIAAPTRKIILPYKKNGELIDTLNKNVRAYISLNNENDIARYLYEKGNNKYSSTEGVLFSFKENNTKYPCVIEFSLDDSFTKIVASKTIMNNIFTIYNLEPNTYYYRIVDKDNNSSLTDFFSLTPIRTINTGDNGVANMRDIGGWPTLNGDRIRYGKLYRSALPSNIDYSVFYSLGIKTELDLRIKSGDSADEIGDFCGINPAINYVMGVEEGARFWPQYDELFKQSYKTYTQHYFKKVFDLLSNDEAYPIVFHCKSGADRTGTLAYIINGLCGVSYENLTKDFEMTSFYLSNRFRSSIIENEGVYSFDNSGIMGNVARWGYFHNQMIATYGGENISLSRAIFKFLTEYCEVEENNIKAALSNIVDGSAYLDLFE